MKKAIVILFFVIGIVSLKAQQVPLYSMYMMNDYLINPGVAGSKPFPCIPIRLTGRQQWMGIEDAPQTGVLSAHAQMKNQHVGIGGMLYNDKFGPITTTGFQGTYAYHLDITTTTRLGLGLSGSIFQFKVDERTLKYIDDKDEMISNTVQSTYVPDANFGAYLYHGKFYVGLSAQQLLQLKIKLGDIKSKGMIRHYFAMAGYKFNLSEETAIEPSGLIKATGSTQIQIDGNLKIYFKKNYYFAVSYRHKDAAIAMIGFKWNRYIFGYAYDYTLSPLRTFNNGSHEFVIGYNLKEGAGRGSTNL